MGVILPSGTTLIAFDTSPFIYYIEKSPEYLDRLHDLFLSIEQGRYRAVTSALTLAEVLVLPLRRGRADLVKEYEELFYESTGLLVVSIDGEIAREAARIRATYNLRTPDAIQVATAIHQGAQALVTNDSRPRVRYHNFPKRQEKQRMGWPDARSRRKNQSAVGVLPRRAGL